MFWHLRKNDILLDLTDMPPICSKSDQFYNFNFPRAVWANVTWLLKLGLARKNGKQFFGQYFVQTLDINRRKLIRVVYITNIKNAYKIYDIINDFLTYH